MLGQFGYNPIGYVFILIDYFRTVKDECFYFDFDYFRTVKDEYESYGSLLFLEKKSNSDAM